MFSIKASFQMSWRGIFLACKWYFFRSISPCSFIVNLVISLSITSSIYSITMLKLPLSIPSWKLCLSCLVDCITGTEIFSSLLFPHSSGYPESWKINQNLLLQEAREMMKTHVSITILIINVT